MRIEAQTTLQNVALLLAQRGAQVVSGLFFAVLVPRLMGPDAYGQYTLVTSLCVWFVFASTLGFTQVIGHYVPLFLLKDDRDRLQAFFQNLLTMRLLSGLVAAGLYLLLTRLWLQDIDPLVLILVATIVFARALTDLLFAFFIGLNQAARWGMRQFVRGWASLLFVIIGFYWGSLRGAVLGLLLSELIVLLVAIRWSRGHLSWSCLRWRPRQMTPYLRFGLVFFAGDLLLAAFRRSGEAMIRAVSRDYAQVGYFGLAFDIYLAAALAIPDLTLAFAPLFSSLLTQGATDKLRQWVERLIKSIAAGGVVIIFGALLLGDDLVPGVLGAAYRPVAANLLPLALAIPTIALSSVARLLALVYGRPQVALAAAAVRLAVFWGLGPLFVTRWASWGGTLAVLVASILYAAYFTWRTQRVHRYSLRSWALAVVLGGLFLPLVWLRASWGLNLALYSILLCGYGGLLFLTRVITPGEMGAIWRVIEGATAGKGKGP
jgi:O-antigen/teichoic acid export membrane protein